MRPGVRPAIVRYGYAVLVVVALAAALALRSFDLEGFLFVIAVPVAVWLGGRGPGVLAVLLSVVVLHYVFIAPADTGAVLPSYAYFVVFSVLSVLVTVLSESRHRAEQSLVQARDELEAKVQERTAELERSNRRLRDEVTERKRVEEELRRNEAVLMEGQRLSHTGSWILQTSTGTLRWSPEHFRIMGYDPTTPEPSLDVILGRVHPEDRQRVQQLLDSALRNEADLDIESRIVRPDGTIRHVVSVAHPIVDESGRLVEMIGTIADVTERRAAEQEIRKQADLLSLAHDAVIVREHDGRITFWNRGAEATYGWTAKEALGQVSHELLRTTFPVPMEEIDAITRQQGRWDGELVHVRRDGATIVVASRWSLQRDERGAPIAILEINRDVTDRKRAEEALQASERELRLLVDTFPGMVSVAGANGAHEYSNRRVSDFLGKELRTVGYRYDIHPDDLAAVANNWVRCTETGEAMDITYRLRRFDGVYRWITTRVEPLRDAQGNIVRWYSLLIDVDDQKTAEEALRTSRAELEHVTRVTTLGEVTASLAHEVNQPLAAIANNANACLGLLPSGAHGLDEVRAALGDIVSDAERASAVIQRVRALAKRSLSERTAVKLGDVVADVVALAASESEARRVTIRAHVPADLPVVSGDRVQLQQVLLNLVVNGMDAMSSVDGVERLLEIRGRPDTHDGTSVAIISVRDRGIGLDAVQMERLFETFYTTKPHGMGMGLAISRSIIEAHGGRLWAAPNQGPGATFSFDLPATAASAS